MMKDSEDDYIVSRLCPGDTGIIHLREERLFNRWTGGFHLLVVIKEESPAPTASSHTTKLLAISMLRNREIETPINPKLALSQASLLVEMGRVKQPGNNIKKQAHCVVAYVTC